MSRPHTPVEWASLYHTELDHPSRNHAIEHLRRERRDCEYFACAFIAHPGNWDTHIVTEMRRIESVRQALALLNIDDDND